MVVLVALLLSGCSTITLRISRGELQTDLEKRFPREVNKHLVTFRVRDPRLDIPGRPDILGVRVHVTLTGSPT